MKRQSSKKCVIRFHRNESHILTSSECAPINVMLRYIQKLLSRYISVAGPQKQQVARVTLVALSLVANTWALIHTHIGNSSSSSTTHHQPSTHSVFYCLTKHCNSNGNGNCFRNQTTVES